MAAVAAAVAVAAAADFVAEMWSYARSSCSGGTPIPFRLPCKVRHFLRRAVAAAGDDESMPQSRRGLLAVANAPAAASGDRSRKLYSSALAVSKQCIAWPYIALQHTQHAQHTHDAQHLGSTLFPSCALFSPWHKPG